MITGRRVDAALSVFLEIKIKDAMRAALEAAEAVEWQSTETLAYELLAVLKSANLTYLGDKYTACIDPKILENVITKAEHYLLLEPPKENKMITDRQVDMALLVFLETKIKDAVREALEAAEQAAWLPIESVPKNEMSVILAFWEGKRLCWITKGFYSPIRDCFLSHDNYDCQLTTPTHWMPLPEPPKE